MKIQQSILASVLMLCMSSAVFAQTQPSNGVAATVNGVKVLNKDLELMVKTVKVNSVIGYSQMKIATRQP